MSRIIVALITSCMITACVSDPERSPIENISQAEKLQSAGIAKYQEHDYESAYKVFNKALYRYRTIDNPEGIVSSCINIARTLNASNQIPQAKLWVEQAERLNNDYRPDNKDHLARHISLLSASIDIAENETAAAINTLSGILKDNTDPRIELSALQLRTQIAITSHDGISNWLKRYADAISKKGNSAGNHQARLLRFQATIESDRDKQARLYRSALDKYRDLAHKPGIAATLSEWAHHDILAHDNTEAENKLLRALLIRLELKDKPNALSILQQLDTTYRNLAYIEQAEKVAYWKEKLDDENFIGWRSVMRDFEDYPD